MNIYSKNKIALEAEAAAVLHSNVNDCCPYPFDTDAGRLFRQVFEAACKEVDDAIADGAAIDIMHSLDRFEAVPA